jgi:pimeloyl-ACP methyl ester carboxylesterase
VRPGNQERDVRIAVGPVTLHGDLALPPDPRGLVIFAHGSASSRKSRRNREVAATLQRDGLATLLFDLLTLDEESVDRHTAHLRFDIEFLAERLVAATVWTRGQNVLRHLSLGYFGASTGAAVALVAAAEPAAEVAAIVSRGGRPDLAGPALQRVRAPTLLIVGGADQPVVGMNERARALMRGDVELKIVPGASHLFEEAGALEEVARLASDWFTRYLVLRAAA